MPLTITFEGWDAADRQPVRGQLVTVDRAQTQAAELVTVGLASSNGGGAAALVIKQNPLAVQGGKTSAIRVGAVLWDGAFVLAAWLDAQPPGAFAGKRCLELGAGLGLPGLVLARLGAAVWLTDKPDQLVRARGSAAKNGLLAPGSSSPLPAAVAARQQAQQQQAQLPPPPLQQQLPLPPQQRHGLLLEPLQPGRVRVLPLDWDAPAGSADYSAAAVAAAIHAEGGPLDLIVATDCVYPEPAAGGAATSAANFLAAARALLTPGRTRVLVAFETRDPALRAQLLAAAQPQGLACRQVERPQQFAGASHIELFELAAAPGCGATAGAAPA